MWRGNIFIGQGRVPEPLNLTRPWPLGPCKVGQRPLWGARIHLCLFGSRPTRGQARCASEVLGFSLAPTSSLELACRAGCRTTAKFALATGRLYGVHARTRESRATGHVVADPQCSYWTCIKTPQRIQGQVKVEVDGIICHRSPKESVSGQGEQKRRGKAILEP